MLSLVNQFSVLIQLLTAFFSLLYGAVSNLMDTNIDPNTSVQSAQPAVNQTTMNQTTADRLEENKYKIPILSDRETDLTKINRRMWWEQISEYIYLTYNRNLGEIMDQGIDQIDLHTVYHIKGDVNWALWPEAKHEIMRGQWGRELKDVDLQELLKLFKKTFIPARNVFHSRAQFFNIKQEDNETLDEYWKRLVDIEGKCEFNRIPPIAIENANGYKRNRRYHDYVRTKFYT